MTYVRMLECDRCHATERVEERRANIVFQHEAADWKVVDGGKPTSIDPCGDLPAQLLCPTCVLDFHRFMAGGQIK